MTATSAGSRRPVPTAVVVVTVLLALAAVGCARPPGSSSRPIPARTADPSGVLQLLRSQGVGWCRGLVADSAPGSGSRRAVLRAIARELGADGSDAQDIAALVGRELAGPSSAQEPVDAAAEGCLLGLRQGFEGLGL